MLPNYSRVPHKVFHCRGARFYTTNRPDLITVAFKPCCSPSPSSFYMPSVANNLSFHVKGNSAVAPCCSGGCLSSKTSWCLRRVSQKCRWRQNFRACNLDRSWLPGREFDAQLERFSPCSFSPASTSRPRGPRCRCSIKWLPILLRSASLSVAIAFSWWLRGSAEFSARPTVELPNGYC